jgi:HK97 family phage portal protein
MLHGNAFLQKIYGGAGQLLALKVIHPLFVSIELPLPGDEILPKGGKWFRVMLLDGRSVRWDATQICHIMALSLDGFRGLGVIECARNSLGMAIAGDRAAAKMFDNGALIAGFVSSDDDDFDESEATKTKEELQVKVLGWENAGTIPIINRKLKFNPWQMTAADAQFLESRKFSVEEICRWFGVPPQEVGVTGAVSNWGTGVEQHQIGMARFNLNLLTSRIEQTLSRLKPSTVWVEFDYHALERPTPEDEIALLISQIQCVGPDGKPLLTVDEARAILNRPAIEAATGADEPAPAPEPEAVPA